MVSVEEAKCVCRGPPSPPGFMHIDEWTYPQHGTDQRRRRTQNNTRHQPRRVPNSFEEYQEGRTKPWRGVLMVVFEWKFPRLCIRDYEETTLEWYHCQVHPSKCIPGDIRHDI
ncbi:hypothetical protein PAXRUDRAFT_836244 [Paxillus rubicundulus Ve08.2h10]|uniref:Uncharacterized protein n=1 Tax=Paxillus rubicundulus Ve08.2h10 TaxID=930991 RepID=A0A0D0CRU8_9AGAM|nr:hypothetical protein PAXRUDRAFT_836244 [Paxillus rubicundulus Ve08.2h10]